MRSREHKFDIIQASNYLACGLFLTFFRPAPIVVRVSSYERLWRRFYRWKSTLDQRIAEYLELSLLRRGDSIYAPSRLLARLLREEAGLKADVIKPPFTIETKDLDESTYKSNLTGKKYLLFFGSIGFLKGCRVLAQALPNLLSKYPDMYFVFAGKVFGGPDNQTMWEYIVDQAGEYRRQIIYLEPLPHSKLYPIIKHAQAVVLPSLIDNLPNAMLEAMALGKVVIGTRNASFEELIDNGLSGIIVDSNNPSQLDKAMERAWNMSDSERESIGEKTKRRIKDLSPEKTGRRLVRYFERFINHGQFGFEAQT